jgi:hypothetical protein
LNSNVRGRCERRAAEPSPSRSAIGRVGGMRACAPCRADFRIPGKGRVGSAWNERLRAETGALFLCSVPCLDNSERRMYVQHRCYLSQQNTCCSWACSGVTTWHEKRLLGLPSAGQGASLLRMSTVSLDSIDVVYMRAQVFAELAIVVYYTGARLFSVNFWIQCDSVRCCVPVYASQGMALGGSGSVRCGCWGNGSGGRASAQQGSRQAIIGECIGLGGRVGSRAEGMFSPHTRFHSASLGACHEPQGE